MLAAMPTWLRSLLSCARRFRNCVVMIAIPIPIHTHDAPDEPVFDLFFFQFYLFFFHFGHVTGQSGRLLERSGP